MSIDDEARNPDDEIDRALASLTDASPSAALKANVMRRVAGGRSAARSGRASGLRSSWRVALVSAAVVLLALATWLLPPWTRRTAPTGGHAVARDIALPAPHDNSAGRAEGSRVETAVRAARRARPSSAKRGTVQPVEDVTSITPVELSPIADAVPVTMTPLTTNPIEIPPIEIRPLDGPPGEGSQPAGEKPDKTQPGGPGAVR